MLGPTANQASGTTGSSGFEASEHRTGLEKKKRKAKQLWGFTQNINNLEEDTTTTSQEGRNVSDPKRSDYVFCRVGWQVPRAETLDATVDH